MELRILQIPELAQLYAQELQAVFPPAELKPLAAMEALRAQGKYDPLGVWEGDTLLGYALIWLDESRRYALLDYLGVMRGKRSSGLGTEILGLLGTRYTHIFGEAEAPDDGDAAVNDLRSRRLGFYLRNGFRILDYDCALFGVHFKCLYRGPEGDDGAVLKMHRKVYADHFSPAHMARCIQLPLQPGEAILPQTDWLEEA